MAVASRPALQEQLETVVIDKYLIGGGARLGRVALMRRQYLSALSSRRLPTY